MNRKVTLTEYGYRSKNRFGPKVSRGSQHSRRRVVKKSPLGQEILAYPLDLYLYINEKLGLIDFDGMSTSISGPIGIAGSLLVLVCRLYFEGTRSSPRSPHLVFRRPRSSARMLKHSISSDGQISGLSSLLAAFFSLIVLLLLILSTINMLYTFTRTRKYTLLGRSLNNPPDTPSASLTGLDYEISSNIGNDGGCNESTNYINSTGSQQAKGSNVLFSSMPLTCLKQLRSASPFSFSSEKIPTGDTWQINVWTPPLFNLALVSYFSPLHVLAIFYLPLSFSTFVAVPVVSIAAKFIITKFQVLLKDKNIIYSEVFNEYEKKVVRPKLSIQKRDVAVGTDDSPAIFYPSATNHVFQTHDVRPNNLPVTWIPSNL